MKWKTHLQSVQMSEEIQEVSNYILSEITRMYSVDMRLIVTPSQMQILRSTI